MLLELLIDWRTWGSLFATLLTSVTSPKALVLPAMIHHYPHQDEPCRHHW